MYEWESKNLLKTLSKVAAKMVQSLRVVVPLVAQFSAPTLGGLQLFVILVPMYKHNITKQINVFFKH